MCEGRCLPILECHLGNGIRWCGLVLALWFYVNPHCLNNTRPIYKGKSYHMTMDNYRPISVINQIAKIIGKKGLKPIFRIYAQT